MELAYSPPISLGPHSHVSLLYFGGSEVRADPNGIQGEMAARLVRPERFELPTCCSGGNRSIQLSYGRMVLDNSLHGCASERQTRRE